VWEYVPLQPPAELTQEADVRVQAIRHDRMVVLTQDCDLLQDFNLRSADGFTLDDLADVADNPRSVPSVALCDMFDEIKSRIASGSAIFNAVKKNQNERYHTFAEAPVGSGEEELGVLPALYLDFRKTVALPTPFLYEAVRAAGVSRLAVVPPFHIHDLIHRFHGYHSRVAVEE
jgi:hypothetical protein